MKWFKHHNDMLSNSKMQILLDKHGPAGPYAWIRLMEILAEEFNVDTPGMFMLSKRKIFTEIFPTLCQKTGKKILDFFQSETNFSYKIYGKEIVINCPEIRELADEYTQKVLKKREEEKAKDVGTESGHGVGTSFVSSSRENKQYT